MPWDMGAFFISGGAQPSKLSTILSTDSCERRCPQEVDHSNAERAKRTTVTPARAWRTEGMTSTQSS